MMGISDAAESIGFRTRGYRLTWEQLRDEVPLPCIVHWNQRHFVVVYEIKKRMGFSLFSPGRRAGYEVLVADPASGLLKYNRNEFLKCWYSTKNDSIEEGTALILEPGPDFYQMEDEKKNKLNSLYLLNYLRPYYRFILQIILGDAYCKHHKSCSPPSLLSHLSIPESETVTWLL